MRTARIKTAEYKTLATWTSSTWAANLHPATWASLMHSRVSRRWDCWSGRSRWAESLRIGWAIYNAIQELNSDRSQTVKYNGANLASFAEIWNRQGDFFTVSAGDFYIVIDLRSMSILYAPNSPSFRMVDALDYADGKNWDRQIEEATWVLHNPTTSAECPGVEAYRYGQTDNWTGD